MKHKLFNYLMVAIFVTALALSAIGTAPVAAQSNTNVTDWESEAYLADLAAGKVNAIYEPSNPIPVEAPEEVLEALKRGAYLVVVEPWKAGCGDNPVQNTNCNVGFVRSFTDWTKMRNFLYSAESEANEGHFGPWTDGSIKISYIREMTPDEMDNSDWAQYIQGKVRVNFAENKPLPATDPTKGLVNHALTEPWRHGCNGDSANPNCQVGNAMEGGYQAVLDYLKKGNWTRGSIVAWPKEASATTVPSNTPAVTNTPAAGTPVVINTPATPANGTTIPPTATVQPTFTATPGAVGEEVPTDEGQVALPVAETPREGGGFFNFWTVCCAPVLILGILAIAFRRQLRKKLADWGLYPYSEEELAAQQPAEEGAGEENLEQPAEEGAG